MTVHKPDSFFESLEAQFNALAAAVATGEAESLPQLAEQVQRNAINLATVWEEWQHQGLAEPALAERVKALAEGLQIVRTSLTRRAMLVEQTLGLVVPASLDPTYATTGVYGAGPKASGRFLPVSA